MLLDVMATHFPYKRMLALGFLVLPLVALAIFALGAERDRDGLLVRAEVDTDGATESDLLAPTTNPGAVAHSAVDADITNRARVSERASDDPLRFEIVGRLTFAPPGFSFDCSAGHVFISDSMGTTETGALHEDGSFRFVGLSAGDWRVMLTIRGLGMVMRSAHLTRDQPIVELEFEFDSPTYLVIRLTTADEEPLVIARPQRARRAIAIVAHDTDGWIQNSSFGRDGVNRTSFDLDDSGFRARTLALLLPAKRPRFVSLFCGSDLIETRALDPVAVSMDWKMGPLRPGTVIVQVVDDDGRGLEDVSFLSDGRALKAANVLADGDGTFHLVNLSPGWHELTVTAAGRERRRERVLVPSGGDVSLELTLGRGVDIEGTVVDVDGEPISMTVRARALDAPVGSLAREGVDARQGPHGRFSFSGLRAGRYALRTNSPDDRRLRQNLSNRRASSIVEVDAQDSVRDVVLRLEQVGSLFLVPSAAPDAPLSYELTTSEGHSMRAGEVLTASPIHLRVPHGTYQLQVRSSQGVIGTWSVDVSTSPLHWPL